MDARKIWELLKEQVKFDKLSEIESKSDLNKLLYAASQPIYDEVRKWCKAQIKEHTGDEAGLIKRLEPMEPEERRREVMLLMDSAIDGGDVDTLKKLLESTDKIYGLAGDNAPKVEVVAFAEAFPDLDRAVEVFTSHQPVIETESKEGVETESK